jgi:predicted DNA-binding ribbon-helix-helix protein
MPDIRPRGKADLRAFGGDFYSLARFDMSLAEPVARSVRLNGKSTCVRLERIYWAILDRAALENHRSIGNMLSSLDREVQFRFGGVRNFSSLARVVAVAQLMKMLPELAASGIAP